MKNILKIILTGSLGFLTFIGVFILDKKLIDWIISGFKDPNSDLAIIAEIILWIFTFSITFSLAMFISMLLVTLLINFLFD